LRRGTVVGVSATTDLLVERDHRTTLGAGPGTSLRIRRARVEDLEAISEAEASIYTLEGAWELEEYQEAFCDPRVLMLVLESSDHNHTMTGTGGLLAGYAVGRLGSGRLEIDAITTLPGQRRRGGGSALLEVLLSWARTQAVREAALFVRVRNRGAVALYRQYGFEVAETLPGFYDEDVAAYEMRLELL
jgi:[ribosomal protein S18]-alanine N-acetyltransferase